MPTNRVFRRRNWHRYPDTIQELIAGSPIAENEANRQVLITVYYFHHYDELGADVIERAGEILSEWRARRPS